MQVRMSVPAYFGFDHPFPIPVWNLIRAVEQLLGCLQPTSQCTPCQPAGSPVQPVAVVTQSACDPALPAALPCTPACCKAQTGRLTHLWFVDIRCAATLFYSENFGFLRSKGTIRAHCQHSVCLPCSLHFVPKGNQQQSSIKDMIMYFLLLFFLMTPFPVMFH